ncbi:DUF6950 family protein [Novosphingobium sp.]|uniref:DUF6950 family protein n=1 Tax=Novosphingobium sp. TaxID=1874826 RepID=UPI00286DD248|nr:hypothetical protein [Novosphingobium sp.]
MSRLPDWERRLSAYLADDGRNCFIWGESDCALFATGGAAAMTGEDRVAHFRGVYTTRAGSARALRDLGKGTLIKTMNALWEPVRPAFAQRGDMVMVRQAVGICMGRDAIFLGLDGFERATRAEFTHGWRV